jgi:hypothetical protein
MTAGERVQEESAQGEEKTQRKMGLSELCQQLPVK